MTADPNTLVDIHSHLVPGVDDGARDLAAVLASVERMAQMGISRIATTPHIRGSLTHDTGALGARLDEVTEAWETAAAAVREKLPNVEYRRGHEILLDVPEPDLSDSRIRMAGTSFALVEWPRLHIPPGTPRVLRWIRDQGYRPVIAHPERYGGMLQNPNLVLEWKDAGAFLQVNYGSIVGRYGTSAEVIAWRLLEAGLVDYLASDFHGQPGMKIYKSEAWDELRVRGADEEVLSVLCGSNPARLLDDLEPLPVVGIPPESPKLLDRLRGMIGWRSRSMEGQRW
jgi:protein-tyrosine phosphatase